MLPHETRNDVEARSRSEIARLQEQVEVLTREVQEQARLNGMGAERELVRLARTERAEAERGRLLSEVEALKHDIARHIDIASALATENARIEVERDRLRLLEKDTSDKFFAEHQRAERLEDAIRRVIDPAPGCPSPPWVYGILFTALQKEPQP